MQVIRRAVAVCILSLDVVSWFFCPCLFAGNPGKYPEKQAHLHRDSGCSRDEHGPGEIPGGKTIKTNSTDGKASSPCLFLVCSLFVTFVNLRVFRLVRTDEEPSCCLWPEERCLRE